VGEDRKEERVERSESRRKGSLTRDAFPKQGKRRLSSQHQAAHRSTNFPSTPPTSRMLACRFCWTVRPEGMGAAGLQDCETRRDYYCSMSVLDMFGWSLVSGLEAAV
jgi:hypothetical protein